MMIQPSSRTLFAIADPRGETVPAENCLAPGRPDWMTFEDVPEHLWAPRQADDDHRNRRDYAEDRIMILAFFGVDGDYVPRNVFDPLCERLSCELGMDAQCVRDREAVFIRFGTVQLSDEQRRELDEDELNDVGLDPDTARRRARALFEKRMTDPAVERSRAHFGSTTFPALLAQEDRSDEASPPAEDASSDEGHSEREALYLEALAMSRRGRTQKEIAVQFGKTDRTIRTWLDEARKLQVAALNALSPESVIAEDHELCITMVATLSARLDQAWEKKETRLALDLARELRAWHHHHRQLFNSMEFLSRYEHPETRRARYLASLESPAIGF